MTAWGLRYKGGDRDLLVVQWLRLHVSNAGDLGSIPGRGTRLHFSKLKIPHATMKFEDPRGCDLVQPN